MIGYSQTSRIVRRELDRVEAVTGNRIDDYLYDVAEQAEKDWTEDGYTDLEAVESEIVGEADKYIDFVRETYPEQIREESGNGKV